MKVRDAKNAYNALSKATIATLNDKERLTIFRIRRALKPIAEEYNDFEKDAIDALKGVGFDDMAAKAEAGTLQGEELVKWLNMAATYNKSLAHELKAKQAEDVDITLPERINEIVADKIIAENKWSAGVMDALDVIIE